MFSELTFLCGFGDSAVIGALLTVLSVCTTITGTVCLVLFCCIQQRHELVFLAWCACTKMCLAVGGAGCWGCCVTSRLGSAEQCCAGQLSASYLLARGQACAQAKLAWMGTQCTTHVHANTLEQRSANTLLGMPAVS